MSKEEIKEYLNRVEELELKLIDKDKDTFQWLIYGYNECAKLLQENEQRISKTIEILDKADYEWDSRSDLINIIWNAKDSLGGKNENN